MAGFGGGSGRWVQARTERDAQLFEAERQMRRRERRDGSRPELSATARRRLTWALVAAAVVLVLLVL